MKATRSLLVALLLLLILPAPGIAHAAQLPNPVHPSTAEEVAQKTTGFVLAIPEGVKDAVYSYIDSGNGAAAVGQAQFAWQGAQVNYRIRQASKLEDISGMYYPWQHTKKLLIGAYLGQVMYNDGGPGVAMWLDDRNQALFSVSMDKGASLQKLMELAYANAEWEQEMPDGFENVGGEAVADSAAAAKAFDAAFATPAEAQNAMYYLIGKESLKNPIGAVYYTLKGNGFIYYLQRGPDTFDPSGRVHRWTTYETVKLGTYDADLKYDAGGEGVISWFDPAQGINRAVAVKQGASQEALLTAAQPFIQ